jgi:hypothetical protein
MSDRDRTIGAAAETLVAAVMVIAGFVLATVAGVAIFGLVLVILGVLALGHAVAVGLGLISYPPRDEGDRDER